MNGSKGIRPCRILALITVLFGVMVATLPAYGQQEVDPSWHDPWAAPSTVAVHSAQPQKAIRRQQRAVRPVSAGQRTAKLRAKQVAARPKSS